MAKFWCKRIGAHLEPYDQQGFEAMEKLPWDTGLRVEVTQPRNAARLRLYHGLVDVCAKGVGVDHESMDDDLRINLGYYHEVKWPDGRIQKRPDSISFDAMPDEAAFATFLERAIQAVYILYGILPAHSRAKLDEILAPKTEKRR